MKWRKLGLLFAPDGSVPWARGYAFMPTVHVLSDAIVRVYFTALDDAKFGRIGFVDLDRGNLSKIVAVSAEPVLDLGEQGTFDDSGVSASCVIRFDHEIFLYYVGWQRCERVPYMLFTGVATSADGSKFERRFQTPVLDRTAREPFLRSGPTIVSTDRGFQMWYNSGLRWTTVVGNFYPTYIIRSARSKDGIEWSEVDGISIDFAAEDEFGLARPWVVHESGVYQMWYSIRSRTRPYRIGYAESIDSIHWTRKDEEAGITASETGWDSQMICYPCVIDIDGRRYMFYNGNRHGSTGFGYAVAER
jgi:hypothetical protein